MNEQEKRQELENEYKKELWKAMNLTGISPEGAKKVWDTMHTDGDVFIEALGQGFMTPRSIDHVALAKSLNDFNEKVNKGIIDWYKEKNSESTSSPKEFFAQSQEVESFDDTEKKEREFQILPKSGLGLDGVQDQIVKVDGQIVDEVLADGMYTVVKSTSERFLYGDETAELFRYLETLYGKMKAA